MNQKILFAGNLFIFLCGLSCWNLTIAQKIIYDTTYNITYRGNVVDSVIIVHKKVIMTEKVFYTIGSAKKNHSVDIMFSPLLTAIKSRETDPGVTLPGNSSFQHEKDNRYLFSMMFNHYRKDAVLSTGIRFLDYQQNFRYSGQYDIIHEGYTQVVDTINSYFSMVNGDTVYFYDTEEIDIYYRDTSEVKYTGRYQKRAMFLGIPIQVGYYKRFSRWALSANTGLVFSFMIGNRNYNHGVEKEVVISKTRTSAFPVAVSVNSLIQIFYLLNENSAISIQPYFEKLISNPKRIPITSNMWGIQIGAKYFF